MRAVSVLLGGLTRLAQVVVKAVKTFEPRSLDGLRTRVAPRRSCMGSILVSLLLLVREEDLEELMRAVMAWLCTMSLHAR